MIRIQPSSRLLSVFFCCVLSASAAFAQGGKAEPSRIEFAQGQTSVSLSGRLKNGEEMEYVFNATKGQKVTVKNYTKSLFDFRVFNPAFDFDTEYDSSPTLTIDVPETGDYNLFIRKKQVKTPQAARFSIMLTIK